jgi:hypothetical protein
MRTKLLTLSLAAFAALTVPGMAQTVTNVWTNTNEWRVYTYIGPDPASIATYPGTGTNLPNSVTLTNIILVGTNGTTYDMSKEFTSAGPAGTTAITLPLFDVNGIPTNNFSNGGPSAATAWPTSATNMGSTTYVWDFDTAVVNSGDGKVYTAADGTTMWMGHDSQGQATMVFRTTNNQSFGLANTNGGSFEGPWTSVWGGRPNRNGAGMAGYFYSAPAWPTVAQTISQTSLPTDPFFAGGFGAGGIPLGNGGGGGGGGGGAGGSGFSIGDFAAPEPLYRDLIFTNGEFVPTTGE